MPQLARLETDLANVLMTELVPVTPVSHAADSDRYPLIEVLRDSAFGVDLEAASTMKFPRTRVVDTDTTIPHALYSSPYEAVDLCTEELGPPRTRRRPTTTRALVRRAPEPYDWIEISVGAPTLRASNPEVARPSARRPSAPSVLASGRFEASWFVAPDDAASPEDEDEPRQARFTQLHILIVVAAATLAAFLTALALA